jgi:hypothetical protein
MEKKKKKHKELPKEIKPHQMNRNDLQAMGFGPRFISYAMRPEDEAGEDPTLNDHDGDNADTP